MDCGIPYCHGTGSVAPGTAARSTTRSRTGTIWSMAATGKKRSRNLHSTNNFPEFTGRICPAPCEASCTLNIDDNPVTIKTIECAIVDRAWEEWLDQAEIAAHQDRQEGRGRRLRPGGPGLRAAARARRPRRASSSRRRAAGGLLRYGIPDFKMEKHLIDRRVAQMEAEGVTFHYGNPCRREYRCARSEKCSTNMTPWC
jgi:glutamate synthase (NADPH/NADH) small chain